jgi:acyl-[acyl-carrier-protein]-phospholipid O-acyltransferase/long-chain-fatty-acid--[acyl-carrier-protein] ligase
MELEALELQNLKYSLFSKRRFLPIFLATFLGAFNDNMLRSGLVVMIAYSASKGIALPTRPEILVTICSALLVLPMLLFSSLAGTLADKLEKSFLVVCTKIAEMGIMTAACYGFATQNIYLLMGMLFISGTHTAFYSPIKFSILPDHLQSGELLAGNGFMSGGSYLAVLFGLIAGGLLVEMPGNVIGQAAVSIAVVGLCSSLFIPKSKAAHPDAKIDFNLFAGTKAVVLYTIQDRGTMRTIFVLSWFMLVGSVYMSQFANYAQSVVHANNEVYILFLTSFSIGIAAGSLLCDTLLKGEISPKLTPIAALGITIFTYTMVYTTPKPEHEGLLDVVSFLSQPKLWPVLGSMVMVAVCGGIYMVPLYTLLQSRAHAEYRSRVIAASNMSDAIFMTLAALVSALLLLLGFGILDLFVIVATINLFVAWYARRLRP